MTDHDGVRARSFGGVADLYEQTRPTYPRAAVDWLLEGSRGREAVDVGAGTGKLTRALVAAGAAVIAVDPLPEMLERLRRALPGVTALEGSAEAIPVSSGAADLVTAGQAFHWFDAGPALDEIHRVLRPGGVLGLVWNPTRRWR